MFFGSFLKTMDIYIYQYNFGIQGHAENGWLLWLPLPFFGTHYNYILDRARTTTQKPLDQRQALLPTRHFRARGDGGLGEALRCGTAPSADERRETRRGRPTWPLRDRKTDPMTESMSTDLGLYSG